MISALSLRSSRLDFESTLLFPIPHLRLQYAYSMCFKELNKSPFDNYE